VSLHLDQGIGRLGPAIQPGATANYRDVLRRRRAAAEDPDQFAALTSALTSAALLVPQLPAESELVWMLATLCIETERWLVGAPCRLVSVELEANPLTLEYTPYPVLPLPDTALTADFQISAELDASLLLNPRTGVVIRTAQVEHDRSIPSSLVTVQTNVARMNTIYPTWHNDAFSAGSVFDDAWQAYQSAIGEAVERYCGNYMFNVEPLFASYDELLQRDQYALDPDQLVLFSDTMYATPGCPFVPLRRDTRTYWMQGRSLTNDRPARLPASLVYVNWHMSGYDGAPLTNGAYYPGIAAGASLEHAMMSAIQELIERDSTMVWWMNGHPLPAVQLPPELASLWAGAPTEHGQRAWAIHIPNEFGFPVIAGVVEQTAEQFLTIGFACRPDPAQAIGKAWAEALTLQEGSRDINDPDRLTRRSISWGWLRADRAYMDEYRADFRDLTHTVCAEQYYLDPRAQSNTCARGSIRRLKNRLMPYRRCLTGHLRTYQRRVEAQGFEILYCDLTTSDMRLAGWHVVRVLITGLIPEFPEAFPHTGRGRAQHAPVRLGWRTTPLAEADVNLMPIPYA
jgi:ribosomal protein S12 methylthiotransferase accessory factor